MKTETKVLNYTLSIKGIFGRNRKVKSTTVKLIKHVPVSEPRDPAEVLMKADEAIKELHVKPGSYWRVDEEPITLIDYGEGLISENFMMFSGKKLGEGKI